MGITNGLLITRVGINALITTLGMFSVVRGLAFVFSGGLTEPMLDKTFGEMGRGFVAGIPVPVIIFVIVTIGCFVVMRYTQYGRAMYSHRRQSSRVSHLAGLPRASLPDDRLHPLRPERRRGGRTSDIATWAGAPQAATGLEISVIAAVILGGTSLAGGKGTIVGTLIGVLILGTLTNGMILLGVSSYYQQIAQGLVLLLAVGLDQLTDTIRSPLASISIQRCLNRKLQKPHSRSISMFRWCRGHRRRRARCRHSGNVRHQLIRTAGVSAGSRACSGISRPIARWSRC